MKRSRRRYVILVISAILIFNMPDVRCYPLAPLLASQDPGAKSEISKELKMSGDFNQDEKVDVSGLIHIAGQMYMYGNVELAKSWVAERASIKGVSQHEFICKVMSDFHKASLQPSRYPMLAEEMWLYTLPILVFALQEDRMPIFIERSGCMFRDVWSIMLHELSSRGVTGLPGDEEALSVNVKRPIRIDGEMNNRLERTITALMTPEERRRVVDADELREAVSMLSEGEASGLDEWLREKGEPGGIFALAGRSLRDIVVAIVDYGLDERFIKQQDDLQDAYDLFRKYSEGLSREKKETFTLEDVLDELSGFLPKEMVVEIRAGFIRKIGIGLQERISDEKIRSDARIITIGVIGESSCELRGHLEHKARPILNRLLGGTAFAHRIRNGKWLAVDDGTATGSTPLSLEVLAKCFDKGYDYKFAVYYVSNPAMQNVADMYSNFREVHPYEDATHLYGNFFRTVVEDGVPRIEKVSFEDYLRRIDKANYSAEDDTGAVSDLETFNARLNKVIDDNIEYLSQGMDHVRNDRAARPDMYFWAVLAKRYMRRGDSMLFDFLVNEYFMDYEVGGKDTAKYRAYQEELGIIMGRMAKVIPEGLIHDYDILWPEDERRYLERIMNEYDDFKARVQQGMEVLGDPLVLHAVQEYLDHPSEELFGRLREMIIPNIFNGSSLYVATHLFEGIFAPVIAEASNVYEIRYDTSRLSPSQVEVIESYITRLKAHSLCPANIKKRPFRDPSRPLISVMCRGDGFEGEGCVDVKVNEQDIGDYLLKIPNMLNMAIAASHIPSGIKSGELADEDKYGRIIDFIKAQYKEVLGEDMPVEPGNMSETFRNIVLILPPSHIMPHGKITEYNKLTRIALAAV